MSKASLGTAADEEGAQDGAAQFLMTSAQQRLDAALNPGGFMLGRYVPNPFFSFGLCIAGVLGHVFWLFSSGFWDPVLQAKLHRSLHMGEAGEVVETRRKERPLGLNAHHYSG